MNAQERADALFEVIRDLPDTGERHLIAIAGPPAVGKTTLTKMLYAKLEHAGIPTGIVAMDGFHFDNDHLSKLGLLQRKGAPQTFDLDAFKSLLEELKSGGDVAVPLFDRAKDKTLPDAGLIHARDRHILIEGNYLLLDQNGWRDLARLWTFSVFVHDDIVQLEQRLIDRWIGYGLNPVDAKTRAMQNDLPNAQFVIAHRLRCDLVISQ